LVDEDVPQLQPHSQCLSVFTTPLVLATRDFLPEAVFIRSTIAIFDWCCNLNIC
jgi:hypothetical protein